MSEILNNSIEKSYCFKRSQLLFNGNSINWEKSTINAFERCDTCLAYMFSISRTNIDDAFTNLIWLYSDYQPFTMKTDFIWMSLILQFNVKHWQIRKKKKIVLRFVMSCMNLTSPSIWIIIDHKRRYQLEKRQITNQMNTTHEHTYTQTVWHLVNTRLIRKSDTNQSKY